MVGPRGMERPSGLGPRRRAEEDGHTCKTRLCRSRTGMGVGRAEKTETVEKIGVV